MTPGTTTAPDRIALFTALRPWSETRGVALLIMLLAFWGCGSRRVQDSYGDVPALSEGISYFYTHPSQTGFDTIAASISRLEPEITGKDRTAMDLMAVFLWRAKNQFSYRIPEALDDRTRAAIGLLDSDHPAQLQEWVSYIRSWDTLDPHKLDIAWSSFFATGDLVYLDIIYSAATAPDQPDAIDLTSSTAKWSLKANAKQHAAVLAYLKRKKDAATEGSAAAFPDECIAWANAK